MKVLHLNHLIMGRSVHLRTHFDHMDNSVFSNCSFIRNFLYIFSVISNPVEHALTQGFIFQNSLSYIQWDILQQMERQWRFGAHFTKGQRVQKANLAEKNAHVTSDKIG